MEYGKTASGVPLTEQEIEQRADEAEAGYDVEETLRRRVLAKLTEKAQADFEALTPEEKEAVVHVATTEGHSTASCPPFTRAMCRYRRVIGWMQDEGRWPL